MELITYLTENYFKQSVLPKNLVVSTISLTFKLGTNILIENINKYLELCKDDICTIDYNGNYRSIVDEKKKNRKNFHNSITIKIAVRYPKLVNFKIFTNGAVQIAGIKSIEEGNIAINHLVRRLNETIGIYNKDTGKLEEVRFIESEININNLQINLINVNFEVGYSINRDDLYRLLLSQSQECYYERCKHAAVSVKYKVADKKKPISIFVFDTGSIVITGSSNEEHIMESYNYITNLLSTNKSKIVKVSIDVILENILRTKFSHLVV